MIPPRRRLSFLLLASALSACGARTPIDLGESPRPGDEAEGGQGGQGQGGSGTAGSSAQGGSGGSSGKQGKAGSAGQGGSGGGSTLPADVACWQATIDPGHTMPPGDIVDAGPAGCSLVGTWAPASGSPPLTISFDDAGHYVLGPLGANLCTGHTESGEYGLGKTRLGVWNRQGKGVPGCAVPPLGEASYKVQFATDCKTVFLSASIDSCTGGGLFQGGAVLLKKP